MNPRQQLPRLVHPATVCHFVARRCFCDQLSGQAGWWPLNKRHFCWRGGWKKWRLGWSRWQISRLCKPPDFFFDGNFHLSGLRMMLEFHSHQWLQPCNLGEGGYSTSLFAKPLWGDSMDWHPFAWRPAGWRCWKWMRTVVRSGWLIDIQQFAVCFGTVLAV